jgi:hypothetical protein
MWDQRGGRRYYYRSERDSNGRPRRRYLGTGAAAAAQQAAAEDEQRRRERQAADATWEAELAELMKIDALVEELCRVSEGLLALALMDAGYEKMRRGHWRRKHGSASRSGERPENGPEN